MSEAPNLRAREVGQALLRLIAAEIDADPEKRYESVSRQFFAFGYDDADWDLAVEYGEGFLAGLEIVRERERREFH